MLTERNPMIRDIQIGKKKIKVLKLYPLSIRDQFGMTNILNNIVAYASNSRGISDQSFILFMLLLIKENLSQILDLVTGQSLWRKLRVKYLRVPWKYPESPLIKNMTIDQATEVAMSIYQMNYEPTLKKVESLLDGTVELPEALRRLWLFFSGGSPSIAMKTSTEDHGPKED